MKLLVEIPDKEEDGGWSPEELILVGSLLRKRTTPIDAKLIIRVGGADSEELPATVCSIEVAPE